MFDQIQTKNNDFTFSTQELKMDLTTSVKTQELSDLLGISRRRVYQLVKAGMPKAGRGRFNLVTATRWYISFIKRNTTASGTGSAKDRLTLARAGLAEMRLSTEKAESMPVAVVQRAAFESGRKIRNALQGIADRVSPLVASEYSQHECRMILLREINAILSELSETLNVDPRAK